VSFNDLDMRIFAYDNQITGLQHQRIFFSGGKIDDFDGFFYYFAFRNIDVSTFISKSRIQTGQTIVFTGDFVEIFINHHFVFGFV